MLILDLLRVLAWGVNLEEEMMTRRTNYFHTVLLLDSVVAVATADSTQRGKQ